eukprot:snap_masked-scaffold_5-processed-gene-13.51-mRNA-1 protein AED:1.00 eAED:1.00 QI:0/0/0/0/1/1/2/0/87
MWHGLIKPEQGYKKYSFIAKREFRCFIVQNLTCKVKNVAVTNGDLKYLIIRNENLEAFVAAIQLLTLQIIGLRSNSLVLYVGSAHEV